MRYRVEQKIETLAIAAVIEDDRTAMFTVDSVALSHWAFDTTRGWVSHSWLAEGTLEAADFKAAFETFRKGLGRIVPRIALISQTYIDYFFQPLLIVKEQSDIGFLRYRAKRSATGLMFVEDHQEALVRLLADTSIPEAFYYYWNDVVNAVGYTPKLSLMCSAIECLVRLSPGVKDWAKLERILGKELKEDLWGTQENPAGGLRHRLIHGEYFGPNDFAKNYVELIHRKVMAYFNEHVLGAGLLELTVVAPQRHFWGNFEGNDWFIRQKSQRPLSLKSVLADFETNGMDHLKDHDLLHDDSLYATY